jgi:hypothetical protein
MQPENAVSPKSADSGADMKPEKMIIITLNGGRSSDKKRMLQGTRIVADTTGTSVPIIFSGNLPGLSPTPETTPHWFIL